MNRNNYNCFDMKPMGIEDQLLNYLNRDHEIWALKQQLMRRMEEQDAAGQQIADWVQIARPGMQKFVYRERLFTLGPTGIDGVLNVKMEDLAKMELDLSDHNAH